MNSTNNIPAANSLKRVKRLYLKFSFAMVDGRALNFEFI